MKFLEIDEVIVIHQRMLEFAGGKEGIREFILLHSAIERPKAKFGGIFLYETIWSMAAALLQSLVKNHPFEDGNKRTAYFSAMRFLQRNQWILVAKETEYVDFMVQVDIQNKSVKDIAIWLKKHSRFSE